MTSPSTSTILSWNILSNNYIRTIISIKRLLKNSLTLLSEINGRKRTTLFIRSIIHSVFLTHYLMILHFRNSLQKKSWHLNFLSMSHTLSKDQWEEMCFELSTTLISKSKFDDLSHFYLKYLVLIISKMKIWLSFVKN